jgi:hypothetical protein
VIGLWPRDAAFAAANEQRGAHGALAELVGTAWWIVLRQLPVLALVAAAVWVAVARAWPQLALPLALLLAAYLLGFPLRLWYAVLYGLQDLQFVTAVQLDAWVAGTAVTIAAAGAALLAMTLGTPSIVPLVASGTVALLIYAALVVPMLRRPPLAGYVAALLNERWPGARTARRWLIRANPEPPQPSRG